MNNSIALVLSSFVAAAAFAGCQGGGGMNVAKPNPKLEACNSACAEGRDKAYQECAPEADPDACKVAADAALETCKQKCSEETSS